MKPSAYEIGTKYARNGQYDKAIDFLLPAFLCEGSFAAANDLGVVFERKGKYEKAMKYYKIAGCGGIPMAVHNVANLYQYGLGVKQDLFLARKLYEQAVTMGCPLACKKLSTMYLYGLGVEEDHKQSNIYLKKGIKLEKKNGYEDTDCFNCLAWNYKNGIGVKKNDKKAFKLWKKSAKHGDLNGYYHVASYYIYGGPVRKNVSKGLSMLIDLACKHHYAFAMGLLADIYDSDKFNLKNLNQAGHWLLEGAINDELSCFLKIAEICLSKRMNDYGFKRDLSRLAIRDFWRVVIGNEKEFRDEILDYKNLREKFPNDLDWDYLETAPESLDTNEPEELC